MGFFGSPHRPEMEALGFHLSVEGLSELSERHIWVKDAVVIYDDDVDAYLRAVKGGKGGESTPESRAASSANWRRKMG